MLSKRFFKVLCLGMLLFGLVFGVNPVLAQEKKVIQWKLQDVFPQSATLLHTHLATKFIETVEKVSQGRIKITRYEPGVLVPPSQALDALGKGMFEAAVLYPGYNTGKFPISYVEMGLPFSWKDQEASWVSHNKFGLRELLRKEYAKLNIYWLTGGSVNDVYSIASVKPIRKIADIEGMKIRAWGIMAEYVKMLGGTPVSIPAGELYMALKLGTIDGCLSTDWYLETFKLGEVLKYYLWPNPINVAGNVSVNMDAWMALDEPLRIALKSALESGWWGWMTGYGAERRHIANSILPQKYGVQYITLPPKEAAWVEKESMKLWVEKRKISPTVNAAVDTVQKSIDYLRGDN